MVIWAPPLGSGVCSRNLGSWKQFQRVNKRTAGYALFFLMSTTIVRALIDEFRVQFPLMYRNFSSSLAKRRGRYIMDRPGDDPLPQGLVREKLESTRTI